MGISPSDFQRIIDKYYDFHRAYLFRVYFYNNETTQGIKDEPVFITDLISATETPVSTSTQLSVGWMGSKVKVAGKTDFQDWKVTVRDDLTNRAYNFFQQWREEVYNLFDGSSEGLENVGYKRSAIVHLLGGINDMTEFGRLYKIEGIWPKDIGAITLDYATENISTFPVTFSIDYYSLQSQN